MNFKLNRKRAQSLISNKLIILILIVLVIVFVLILIFRPDIINYIKNILPEYQYEHDVEITHLPDEEMASLCKFDVAVVREADKIYFCGNGDCNNLVSSKLIWKGAEAPGGIYYYHKSIAKDIKVGDVTAQGKINLKFYTYLYDNKFLDKDVPGYKSDYEVLVNLDGSYYWQSNILCRPSKISVEEAVRKVKKINVKEIDFYHDVSEYIRNKNSQATSLYLDDKLTKKAKSSITKEGQISRQPEEGETRGASLENAELITKSPQDIEFYKSPNNELANIKEGQEIGAFILKEVQGYSGGLDNSGNKLGADTGGDNFEYVYYKKYNGRIYIRFGDKDIFEDKSPWVLMDYWNEYRTFIKVPEWAILK